MTLNAAPFWAWITERHRIYLKKQAGDPPPWTEDKIMQSFRFCNVFRELDTVTIWLRENWRDPYADSEQLWIAMCLARQINWPETLAEVGFPRDGYDAKSIQRALEARKKRGEKVYTGAYMISAPSGDYRGMAKPEYTAEIVVGALWRARAGFDALFAGGRQPTMQEVHSWLRGFRGWGDFMAYEVVTDLRHTRYLRNAPDINTWAVAGPGAIRGLHRLHGRPYTKSLSQEQACEEMRELLALSRTSLPDFIPPLELREIEHSLCETDKWLRVEAGQGRLRSKYAAVDKPKPPPSLQAELPLEVASR
jgi:cation transport regulator ChaC